MRSAFVLIVLSCLLGVGLSDVYLHMPRGSNNRLNEASANRNNANRLFDSQNNNRGGYNVGDRSANAFNGANPTPLGDPATIFNPAASITQNAQYPMMYYEGSVLQLEWTNQHSCGGHEGTNPQKANCNIVIQYMCEQPNEAKDGISSSTLRDGGNTNAPDAPGNVNDVANKISTNIGNQRGRHESEYWYYTCTKRQRNKGLFTADQQLQGNAAKFTRQNPNGNRNGLECPEERDYYPYWFATPWRDVAYLTDNPDICSTITANSQNNNKRYSCIPPSTGTWTDAIYSAADSAACGSANGVWTASTFNLPAPACQQVAFSRDNHLGNGVDGQTLSYQWTLPTFSQLASTVSYSSDGNFVKCALRLRYNISTDDYNPATTTAANNENPNANPPVRSPVTENPTINVGSTSQLGLKLAVDTAQYGRTFQDRSHVFYIRKKPSSFGTRTVYNLNVRGKRGNIVQTYPAVEYDFVPTTLNIKKNDLIHVQWTGSNTHNNGNPGGDGQTGDAGEGKGGSDRSNMAQIAQSPYNGWGGDMLLNYPLPLDKFNDNMWARSKCFNGDGGALGSSWVDCAITVATSGQYRSVSEVGANNNFQTQLNDSPASLIGGVVMDFSTASDSSVGAITQKTSFSYICTRNNNFSNRSQKGQIVVSP